MTYEECQAILSQFQKQHAAVLMNRNVHGFQVMLMDTEFVLQLVVTKKLPPSQLKPDEVMPKSFSYTFGKRTEDIETDVIESDLLDVEVDAGSKASWSLTGIPFGTVGWNIFLRLQNIWVCLSNWHVLVDPNNPNPGSSSIFLNGERRAQLHAFVVNESWDCALARYNNPSDAAQQFRACEDGTIHPYPQELSKSLYFGDEYRKIGARSPICRTGRLLGVGTHNVRYNNGVIRRFHGQLMFDKMSDPGDSGSVVVRLADNTVTGLHFAGNKNYSVSNPLYLIGWKYLGSIKLVGGGEIPMYDDSSSVIPTRRSPPSQQALPPYSTPRRVTRPPLYTPGSLKGTQLDS